jgi:hypothetical protein
MKDRLLAPFRQEQAEGGYVLLLMLITTLALFISLTGILELSLNNLSSAKRSMFDTSALYAAESGLDRAAFELTAANGSWSGTGVSGGCPIAAAETSGQVQVFNDTVKGKGTYQVCVTNGSISHEYIVYSVGRVFKTSSATTPYSTRRVKAVVVGKPVGAYAVQTGPGGMIMRNSANISQGPVYIGGYLSMSNSASIGTSSLPIAVNVANARCPAGGGATFPTICATSANPNPITMASNQNKIYGTVSANDQTNNYSSQMVNPGLVSTSGVSAPSLPGYDRVAQVNAVTSTITAAAATCVSNSGTVTWPANVKITGNVSITNNCTVIVSGNAWITGSFNMRNSAIIKTASTVTAQPTIMVDGSSGVVTQQTSTVATNATSIGMEFITFYSGAACTLATDASYCDSLTGTNLYNAQSVTTVDIGNQGAAAGSVFYAKYSKVTIGQAGTIGALLGQTIDLAQSGNLSFTSTVVTGNYAYDVSFYDFWNP